MNNRINKNVDEVVRLLRSGGVPDAELAQSVMDLQAMATLRCTVNPGDTPAILRWFSSTEASIVRLASAIAQDFVKEGNQLIIDQITEKLRTLIASVAASGPTALPGKSNQNDFSTIAFLIWRQLDIKNLDEKPRRAALEFIESNWSLWRNESEVWYRDVPFLATIKKKNLPNDATPPTKVWLYLITASLDPDKQGVCALASDYLEHEDPLAREVAARILAKNGVFL